MRVVIDIEADGLNPTQIFCVVIKDIDTDRVYSFIDKDECNRFLESNPCTLIISHNGIGYDWPVLNRLWGTKLDRAVCRDTLVLSRLLDQGRLGGHSLEAWGETLGFKKGAFNDFSQYSEEMLQYCINDVHLNHKVYLELDKQLRFPRWEKAVIVEHEMAFICQEMHENGFPFNATRAKELKTELDERLDVLDREIKAEFLPLKKIERAYEIRTKKDGTWGKKYSELFSNPMVEYISGRLVKFYWEEFNPQSSKQIQERLQGHWDPTDKTEAHKDYTSLPKKKQTKAKLEHFKVYGWKINEVNLATLKDSAPNSARLLVERIMLGNRSRQLKSWLESVEWDIKIEIKNENIVEYGLVIREHLIKNGWSESVSIIENDIGKNIQTNTDILIKENTKDIPNKKELNSEGAGINTEYFQKIIMLLLKSNKVDARCVIKKESNSLSTIVIMEIKRSEDCSAVNAILNSVGLKTEEKESNVISLIRGTFNSLGTNTHRLSHTDPNLGNISAEKTIKYKGDRLRELAIHYGGEFRRLFISGKDRLLVGTDMEGAHLRLFAHFIKDQAFINALVSGDKKLGTDPHSLNKKIIGEYCRDRDLAKTFIFTFLNGGAAPKVSEIFGCDIESARTILDDFISAYPGLQSLKRTQIPRDAERGYFFGLDGRKVKCDSEHLMISRYLQNGEAVVMKHANVLWRQELKKLQIPFIQVNFVHDEFQTIAYNETEAKKIGEIQAESIKQVGIDLGILCPLAGEFKLGRDWLESH